MQNWFAQHHFSKGRFDWDVIAEMECGRNWTAERPPSYGDLNCQTWRRVCNTWYKKITGAASNYLNIRKTRIGLGLFFQKDLIGYDIDQFLQTMQGIAWMADIGHEYNSIISVKFEKPGIAADGFASLFGMIAFANHQCDANIGFGEAYPSSPYVANWSKSKVVIQSLKWIGKVVQDKAAIIYKADSEFRISYHSGRMEFNCECGAVTCRGRKDRSTSN